VADKTFIQSLFIDPPIAIARLGGSSAPMDAYEWEQSVNPRTEGETVVVPAWSLNVLADGSVEPLMPADIKLRDGDRVRPVCPFFEVWAMVSERAGDARTTWEAKPLTTGLLQQNGAIEASIRLRVDAKNRKAARRADDGRLAFGTFPATNVRGDQHTPVVLRGISPPSTPSAQRMIPPGREIPLGSIQMMLPKPQPTTATLWTEAGIRSDVIRFRFKPARGEFYGPRAASQTTPPAVTPGTHDFLRAGAGWLNSFPDGRPNALRVMVPADTVDFRGDRSLGVVDDTCEARLDVFLELPGRDLSAHANVFVGPPDFSPDRRPFLSVADEINDRGGDPATRDARMDPAERDGWIEDLFERVYETVSLLNVDYYRDINGVVLRGDRLRSTAAGVQNDGLPDATRAMGARDRLRNLGHQPLLPPDDDERPVPLRDRASDWHRELSDIDALSAFVGLNPGRVGELVRGPFEMERIENDSPLETMRMPPFMRNSNANALTLSAWQYALLMAWVREAEKPVEALVAAPGAAPVARPMTRSAARRRDAVLTRLGRRGPR
jgi:hypothetical protein